MKPLTMILSVTRRVQLVLLLAGLFAAVQPWARANVRTAAIFGDHMMLQEGVSVAVWGWADAGESVTVEFAGQSQNTTADDAGRWQVKLSPLTVSGEGRSLTVSGKNHLVFNDVVVGDVWLASGQSNMAFGLQMDDKAEAAIAAANDPLIRVFLVPGGSSLEPLADIAKVSEKSPEGKWQLCTPEVMGNPKWGWGGFSAVGYYFAKELRQATGKPVGVIGAYRGATPAQAWTSLKGFGAAPELAHYAAERQRTLDNLDAAKKEFPQKKAEYEAAMREWQKGVEEARANRTRPPKRPPLLLPPDGGIFGPSNMFNGLIAPILPYTIKGVIWYQGEANADSMEKAVEYRILFPALIRDWRKWWGQPELPFLFVQLANLSAPARTPAEGVWPWTREAQLKALELPRTGMAVAVDIGNPKDIHPKDKYDVAKRLSLAARHLVYNEKLVYSGPQYQSLTVEGGKVRLTFSHCGGSLVMGVPPWKPDGSAPVAADKLAGFGIAGDDQKFVWADAQIDGDTVIVSSPKVAKPVAVRYDWANNPSGNLYNKEGLPTSPFRTDSWAAPQEPAP